MFAAEVNESVSMGRHATMKQLEIATINDCGATILESETVGRIAVFTDSLAAIKALEGCEIRSETVSHRFIIKSTTKYV